MNAHWYSFECFAHADESATGLVFDLRIEDLDVEAGELVAPRITKALCPLCSRAAELRDWWLATDSGHGSTSTWAPSVFADMNDRLGRIAEALEQANAREAAR